MRPTEHLPRAAPPVRHTVGMAERNDLDLLGLSRSTAEGQTVALAGALSGQQGRRRTVARVLAFTWLGLMVAGLLGIVGVLVF